MEDGREGWRRGGREGEGGWEGWAWMERWREWKKEEREGGLISTLKTVSYIRRSHHVTAVT